MLSEYQTNQTKARAMVDALSVDQLNWKPAPASWSVAQCLAHMALSNRDVGLAMKDALDRRVSGRPETGGGLPTPGFLARLAVATLEPPPRFKAQAGPDTQPDLTRYGKEILDEYLASHAKMLAVIREGAALNLDAVSFRHPALPLRMPIDAGLELMAAHDRRHLWQAEQVTKAAGFPKS